MPVHRILRAHLVLALALTGPLATAPVAGASPVAAPAARVAVDDRPGHTVSTRDVDGDGERDVVRYVVLDGDRVRISARAGTGTPARAVLDTSLWPRRGGAWRGAAPIDGNTGAELVVGTSRGASARQWTVLTMRHDDLLVQHDPLRSSASTWTTDAYLNGFTGWTREVHGDAC